MSIYKKSKTLFSALLVFTLLFSQTIFSSAANPANQAGPISDEIQIQALTEEPVGGTDYDGYIVSLEKDSAQKIDQKAEEDTATAVIDETTAVVENPEDVLEFAPPDAVAAIEPNYKVSTFETWSEVNAGKEINQPGVYSILDLASGTPPDPLYLAPQNYQWGLKRVDATQAWVRDLRGGGVTVAILDTGLNSNHEDINKDNIVFAKNFIDGYGTSSWQDDNGHGSYVAGIIAAKTANRNASGEALGMAGITDQVKLAIMKVLDENGSGYLDDILVALEAIANDTPKVDVINMSLGHPGTSYAEEQMLNKLLAKGIIIVAAAGNDGQSIGDMRNVKMYPGSYPGIICVGSCNSSGKASGFSTKNNSLIVSAPGENMTGLSKNGKDKYMVGGSGTSFASPVVAAAAVIVKEKNKSVNSAAFLEQLKKTVDKPGGSNWNTSFGYGVLNLTKLLTLIDGGLVQTISFNSNGGNKITTTKSVQVGSSYGSLPSASRGGYKFTGWYTEAKNGSIVSSSTVAKRKGSLTLYAHWTGKAYKVAFNANKGKVGTKSKKVTMGKKYGSLPKPARTGYTFQGWYTKKIGGTKVKATTVFKLKKNQTLYAHWKKK